MFGVRGAPGNTVNHATSYWVRNHSKRVFGDSGGRGVGHRLGQGRRRNPAFRFVNVYRVVTNLGVFDFNGPNRQMRAVSLHPGITPEEVAENTSFEVHDLDDAEPTRLPTADELKLHPRGDRPEVTAGQRSTGVTEMSRLRTPLDRSGRHRASGGADRDGLGGGCAAGVGDLQRRRPRHPGVGDHDTRRTADRGHQGQGRDGQAVRHQHPRGRGRCDRSRRPADPRGREGRFVRVGAEARPDREAQRALGSW